MAYFTNCKTLEQLKSEFKKLAIKNHPDCGGSEEVMKEINKQYDEAFKRLKDIHVDKDGKQYTKESNETPDEFKNIVTALMRMQGVTTEIIGSFIWASGNTRDYKDQLKAMGFRWHSKKTVGINPRKATEDPARNSTAWTKSEKCMAYSSKVQEEKATN